MNVKFITLISLNVSPILFKSIERKFCEIIDAEVFAFSHSCGLESRSRSVTLVLKCRVQ